IGEDVYPILSLQSCLDKRAAKGGVSPQQVVPPRLRPACGPTIRCRIPPHRGR
ncbi:MAG: hypothetical protein E7K05_07060, partial [Serratia marcescens]|nr:hypothetical protein [Serratia marcescens]